MGKPVSRKSHDELVAEYSELLAQHGPDSPLVKSFYRVYKFYSSELRGDMDALRGRAMALTAAA